MYKHDYQHYQRKGQVSNMPVFKEILHTVKALYSPAQSDICPDKSNNPSEILPLQVILFQFPAYRSN